MSTAPRFRSSKAGLLAALLLGAAALPALGQSMGVDPSAQGPRESVRPPDPGDPAPANTIVIYAAVILLGGVALGLCLLPSRRGHQD